MKMSHIWILVLLRTKQGLSVFFQSLCWQTVIFLHLTSRILSLRFLCYLGILPNDVSIVVTIILLKVFSGGTVLIKIRFDYGLWKQTKKSLLYFYSLSHKEIWRWAVLSCYGAPYPWFWFFSPLTLQCMITSLKITLCSKMAAGKFYKNWFGF